MRAIVSSWRSRGFAVVCAIVLSASLAACSGDKKDDYTEGSVETLYNQAMDYLLSGNMTRAAKLFDEVERQHPYSVWATKAELMAAYAHFADDQYDEAIIALDRFIQLHPGNRDVAYAYYLKALSYYAQINDVKRDQSATEKALGSFQELVRRYPNTKYTGDGRRKIDLTRDHLAAAEMDRGRYYLKRKQYAAAINRFRAVVEEYQTSSQVAEALHRLVECYTALGINEEAQKAAAVLGYNFPASDWYVETYSVVKGVNVRPPEKERSFWSWIF